MLAKSTKKIFKIKKKPYFGVTFAQREFFQKTLTTYNCSSPPAFKCQRYRVDWSSNQKLLHHCVHAKTIQSICTIYQIICEIHLIQEPHICKTSTIFGYAHPRINKVLQAFLNLYQHEKNQLISSIHSWDTADFRVPFLTTTTQKLLK